MSGLTLQDAPKALFEVLNPAGARATERKLLPRTSADLAPGRWVFR